MNFPTNNFAGDSPADFTKGTLPQKCKGAEDSPSFAPKPTHLDLFSGIGGFALAAEWAGFQTVAFCEIDKFCQRVLNKNFPNVPIVYDVKKMNGGDYGKINLLTGGFPCQPFSVAGKRRGAKDDRFIWNEMLRVVKEAKPDWVIGENVAGIINMELDNVLFDLENEGYETQAFVIPACAVEAPHRRNRVWVVANSKSIGCICYTLQKKINSKDIKEWTRRPINLSCPAGISKNYIREDNGIYAELDSIKALGNAIVPQVAFEIINAIREVSYA